jgi:hypothetical protein
MKSDLVRCQGISTQEPCTQFISDNNVYARLRVVWDVGVLLVCAKCAQQGSTRPLRTALISRRCQVQVGENAGALGVAEARHHTQNPPGFGPWGFDSPSRHHRFQRSYSDFRKQRECTNSSACVRKVCANFRKRCGIRFGCTTPTFLGSCTCWCRITEARFS